MKKILSIASILILSLSACKGGKEEFKLTATNLPEELEGTYAYIYDDAREVTDSVLITNGALTYVTEAAPERMYVMSVAGQRITFVKEAGEFEFEMVTEEGQDPELKCIKAPENSFYMGVKKMSDEMDEKLNGIYENYQKVVAQLKENPEKEDELLPQINAIQEEYTKTANEISMRYYESNKNNFIGLQAFRQIQFDSNEEMIAAYEAAGEVIKNHPQVKKQYERALSAETTKVGAPFVDFEMINGNGESIMLSNFREEGKYLLVDFFASWCGPCKNSMPTLKEIDKVFAPKGLVTLSIGTWDKLEDYNVAVEEHGISWANTIDTDSKGAEVYGVSGVPTFILFSPEGEILARTHNVEEIKALLEEKTTL